jgi:transcriptional regulator with XRE-family HTH domain
MPISPTLSEGLSRYGIGEAIRTLRLKKKMGLVELGRHSGLSPALLSKIERGRLFPTLPTLLRIALVFSVGLEYFFGGGRERRAIGVIRRRDRRRFPESPDVKDPAYYFESLDYEAVERRMNAYLVDFQPAARTARLRTHSHPGAEFIFVLDGSLELTVGNEQFTLDKEDSIYFDSSRPHAYRRSSQRPCRAVVMTTGG